MNVKKSRKTEKLLQTIEKWHLVEWGRVGGSLAGSGQVLARLVRVARRDLITSWLFKSCPCACHILCVIYRFLHFFMVY